jgi:hypothetical protein
MKPMPIVVHVNGKKTAKQLGDLLFNWFGGAVTVEPTDEGVYLLTMTDFAPDRYEKAQYFCIGFMTAINLTTRIVPGKAGTVNANELNNVRMGDGKEKPTQVIVGDMLKLYVGIGWVDVRRANQSDTDSYPVVVGE